MKRLLFKSVVNQIVCRFLDVLDKMNVPEAGKKFDAYIIDDEDVDGLLSRNFDRSEFSRDWSLND